MHYHQLKLGFVGLGFITGLGFGSGACRGSEPDPNHCARQDGDAACEREFGDERPYCLVCGDLAVYDNGCVEDEPTDHNCYSPCGDMQSFNEDSSCLDTHADGGDGDGDGNGDGTGDGNGEGDGDAPCMGDQDCTAPNAPFCDLGLGACVNCDAMAEPDTSCASLDAGSPICFEGSCVACTVQRQEACFDASPICDLETNECVGCSDHAQCPDSACNFAHGNCFDPTNAAHVDGNVLPWKCNDATGAKDAPYCTISTALAKSGTEALIVLHELGGQFEYIETTSISKPVAILGADGELPIIRAAGKNPALTVTAEGVLVIKGIKIQSGQSTGITVEGGSAWVEASRIVNNTGGGITVDGDGTLMVENSFIGGNIFDVHAIDVLDGSVTILYSTLIAGMSFNAQGEPFALRCVHGSGTTVRNSILATFSEDPAIACTGATIANNALDDPGGYPSSNKGLGGLEAAWFTDMQAGDFHLADEHHAQIDTAAMWRTGDPTRDIDGKARPTTDGAPDVAGADVP